MLCTLIVAIILSINIQVGLNMHLYDNIGDASSSLRGSTSSFDLQTNGSRVRGFIMTLCVPLCRCRMTELWCFIETREALEVISSICSEKTKLRLVLKDTLQLSSDLQRCPKWNLSICDTGHKEPPTIKCVIVGD